MEDEIYENYSEEMIDAEYNSYSIQRTIKIKWDELKKSLLSQVDNSTKQDIKKFDELINYFYE